MGQHALRPQQTAGHRHTTCSAHCRLQHQRAVTSWHTHRWLSRLHHPQLGEVVLCAGQLKLPTNTSTTSAGMACALTSWSQQRTMAPVAEHATADVSAGAADFTPSAAAQNVHCTARQRS